MVEKVKHVEPCSVLLPKKKVPKISVPYGKIRDSRKYWFDSEKTHL